MSKMDDLRAMREARYAANQARAAKASPTGRSPAKAAAARPPVAPAEPGKTPAKARAKAQAKPADETAAPASEELCGHRNMGGRTCTREKDHSAKSHRYS